MRKIIYRKKAFTLVELTVVLFILSIISTIAFMSFVWFSRDARNAKRISDINNIRTLVDVWISNSLTMDSFVDGTWSTITWNNIRMYGKEGYDSLSGSYIAWDVSYNILWIKADNFRDPRNDTLYKIWVDAKNKQFEVAATIESGEDIYDSVVVWDWRARSTNSSIWYVDYFSGDTFYLSWITTAKTSLRRGDLISFWVWEYTIKRLWNYDVVVESNITNTWTLIQLKSSESNHIIKSYNSNLPIEAWTWRGYIPYSVED